MSTDDLQIRLEAATSDAFRKSVEDATERHRIHMLDIERLAFENKVWAFYQAKKATGWSHAYEGDPEYPESLFWRTDSGAYGIRQIESAWCGWQMAKGLL